MNQSLVRNDDIYIYCIYIYICNYIIFNIYIYIFKYTKSITHSLGYLRVTHNLQQTISIGFNLPVLQKAEFPNLKTTKFWGQSICFSLTLHDP